MDGGHHVRTGFDVLARGLHPDLELEHRRGVGGTAGRVELPELGELRVLRSDARIALGNYGEVPRFDGENLGSRRESGTGPPR